MTTRHIDGRPPAKMAKMARKRPVTAWQKARPSRKALRVGFEANRPDGPGGMLGKPKE